MNKRKWLMIFGLALLLSGCTALPTTEILQPTNQVTLPPTFTPVPPTATRLPTATRWPTKTFTPVPTSLPEYTVDGLRFAYIIDGNLYVQDSGGQPVQLTHSGEDNSPHFSDDGQKIVFYRGQDSDLNKIYSINADGSQEQVLVTTDLLVSLNLGYDEFTELSYLVFVPGTHKLLFNTQEAKPTNDQANSYGADINWDTLIVDTDTTEIKLLANQGKGGNFELSPDRNLDVIYTGDFIDVINITGQVIRRHLITYQPNWAGEGINLTWTQDSSKLIIMPPINGNGDGMDGPEPRTIWQYPIKSKAPIEIRLNPLPMNDEYTLSPDGNWIVYGYYYYPGKTDKTTPSGIYLGNLHDGSTQLLAPAKLYGLPYSYNWSPDNEHFIFDGDLSDNMYLGNTQGEIIPLAAGRFIGWIDNNRYIYGNNDVAMGEVEQEGDVKVVDFPIELNPRYFTYVYAKP